MKLEAVIVCDRYSDFLAETLPINKSQFDKIAVVTSPEDMATQRICDSLDVNVLLTDVLGSRWGEFAKARGINVGLDFLDLDGWCLHLDADIALPSKTKTLLDHADLNPAFLYGADRLQVPDYDAWRAHLALPQLQHDGYHVRFPFQLMARFNAWHLGGYAPVGYFQLWNPNASGVKHYPDDHSEADRTDVLFAAQWQRNRRALLPEIAVYHLESEDVPQGTNWAGRQTQPFGSQPDTDLTRPRYRPWRHHHHRPGSYATPTTPAPATGQTPAVKGYGG